jgi:drug/metabolite transporter (DMT)-like permease
MFKKWKSSAAIALLSLVIVTAIWGLSFTVVQNIISQIPVMDFLALRFTVAAIVMFALKPTCLKNMSRRGIWRGIILGVMLGMAYITQTYGLCYASAAVSGFITGMYVVLTPVMLWLILKQKASRNTWIGVVLATAGLGLLSLHGWSIGLGELLTLICAIFLALHIVGLGEWSAYHDLYGLTFLQLAAVAIMSIFTAIPNGIILPPDALTWGLICMLAVLATAVAFFVQTWAQSLVSPTRAAIVMIMEPVFAGLFAVVIGNDRLTIQVIIGAACVLAAMYIVQIKSSQQTPNIET